MRAETILDWGIRPWYTAGAVRRSEREPPAGDCELDIFERPMLPASLRRAARALETRVKGALAAAADPGRCYLDLGGDWRSAVFLAGSARSGTTWLSDVINYDDRYRYVFEPFHPGRVPAVAAFTTRQYLRRDCRDPRFLAPARAVLRGEVRNAWADSMNRRRLSRRRLIKDVRANLLLEWLHANFPGMPIVLLLRHPCAVALSRIELGWSPPLDELLRQEALVADVLQPFLAEIRGAEDPFARQVFAWCIENYVPLERFRPGEIHVVFYEAICREPRREVARLFRFLGRRYDERVFAKLNAPSKMVRPGSASARGEIRLDAWTGAVSAAQVARAVEVLRLFGLDRLYAGDPLPRVDADAALRASS